MPGVQEIILDSIPQRCFILVVILSASYFLILAA
jgi:hypothetical protein